MLKKCMIIPELLPSVKGIEDSAHVGFPYAFENTWGNSDMSCTESSINHEWSKEVSGLLLNPLQTSHPTYPFLKAYQNVFLTPLHTKSPRKHKQLLKLKMLLAYTPATCKYPLWPLFAHSHCVHETCEKNAVAHPAQLHSSQIIVYHCMTLHGMTTFSVYQKWFANNQWPEISIHCINAKDVFFPEPILITREIASKV